MTQVWDSYHEVTWYPEAKTPPYSLVFLSRFSIWMLSCVSLQAVRTIVKDQSNHTLAVSQKTLHSLIKQCRKIDIFFYNYNEVSDPEESIPHQRITVMINIFFFFCLTKLRGRICDILKHQFVRNIYSELLSN